MSNDYNSIPLLTNPLREREIQELQKVLEKLGVTK